LSIFRQAKNNFWYLLVTFGLWLGFGLFTYEHLGANQQRSVYILGVPVREFRFGSANADAVVGLAEGFGLNYAVLTC